MNLFYQVFERGFMRDGEGREIDFRNTIILMTSNLGSQTLIDACTPPEETEQSKVISNMVDDIIEHDDQVKDELNQAQLPADENETAQSTDKVETLWQKPSLATLTEQIKPELLNYFAPALLARMQVIPFLALDNEALNNIVSLKLDSMAKRLQQNHQMLLRVDANVVQQIAAQCQMSDSGARMVNAIIEQQILPGIARSVLEFMAEDDMPDILTLRLDDNEQIEAIFADSSPTENVA